MSLDNDKNPRLRKAKLLCSIKSSISKHGISENILDSLELIQKLETHKTPNSMKSAYCAVAVDCTVRHFTAYVDAVRRIWWGRLREKSDFACDELRVWRERIEGVVLGENVSDEILGAENLTDRALGAVNAYLGEAWAEVGPDLVFGFGEKSRDESLALVVSGGKGERDFYANVGTSGARDGGYSAVEREPSVPDSGGKLIGAVGSSGGDKDESPHNVAQDTCLRDNRALKRERGIIRKANRASKHKHVPSYRRAKGRVKIASVEDPDTHILQSEYDTILTPEVSKLQEELKSSCLELQEVVNDPLPDALREADGLVVNLVKKNTNTECPVEAPKKRDAGAAKSSAHGGVETAQAGETNIQIETERTTARTNGANIQVKMEGHEAVAPIPSGSDGVDCAFVDGNATGYQSHSYQNNVLKRSLMERNGTAQTVEWDDSIDDSPEGLSKRMKLPSPKMLPGSPLKIYRDTRVPRKRKKWSNLEEDTLRMGVQKFGKGNWKAIFTAYRDIFKDRNEVDLKDKWRNLTR